MKNKKAKFNEAQIQKMRDLFEMGFTVAYIARKFDCWPNAVWHHVFDLSVPRKLADKEIALYKKNSILTDKQVLDIRKLAINGLGSDTLASLYNISKSSALSILKGKTYRWLESETSSGPIFPIKIDKIKRKSDLKPGIKPGQKKQIKNGVLLQLAFHPPCAPPQ